MCCAQDMFNMIQQQHHVVPCVFLDLTCLHEHGKLKVMLSRRNNTMTKVFFRVFQSSDSPSKLSLLFYATSFVIFPSQLISDVIHLLCNKMILVCLKMTIAVTYSSSAHPFDRPHVLLDFIFSFLYSLLDSRRSRRQSSCLRSSERAAQSSREWNPRNHRGHRQLQAEASSSVHKLSECEEEKVSDQNKTCIIQHIFESHDHSGRPNQNWD